MVMKSNGVIEKNEKQKREKRKEKRENLELERERRENDGALFLKDFADVVTGGGR
jgi:hypothetical protein